MGREVRRVPKDWEHPRDDNGEHIPLFDGDQQTAAEQWMWKLIAWERGDDPNRGKYGCRWFWDWNGGPPLGPDRRGGHMFKEPRNDLTHLMLYESTSEGTPLSPAFETLEEIAEWAAANATTFADFKATKDEWLSMLRSDFGVHTQVGSTIFM